MTGTVLNFVLLIATPVVLRTRWFSLLLSIFSFVSGILLTVAAIIATVISIAAKVALTAQDQLNIKADIGIKMFAFMWIGAILTDLAFLLHAAMGCCCKPQRNKSRTESSVSTTGRKTITDLPSFVRRRRGGS